MKRNTVVLLFVLGLAVGAMAALISARSVTRTYVAFADTQDIDEQRILTGVIVRTDDGISIRADRAVRQGDRLIVDGATITLPPRIVTVRFRPTR